MKLIEYIKAGPGRQSELCRQIGAHPPDMSRWLKPAGDDSRPIPQERCPDIERATGGLVTCEEMRDDIPWSRIPSADWPHHPLGRPVIDVARAALARAGLAAA